MSILKKVVLLSMSILMSLMSFMPQIAHAHAQPRVEANINALASLSFAAMASFLPVSSAGALAHAMAAEPGAEPATQSDPRSETGAALQSQPASVGALTITGSDLNALLDSYLTQEAVEGLLLVNRKDTWSTQPKDHYEMVQCVEHDSVEDTGWFGASIVTGIDQTENIHGQDDGYTSYYSGYFFVTGTGTWQFRIASDGSSEIEIDGKVVAGVYGGLGDSVGSVELGAGWHHMVYRHQEWTGTQLVSLEFAAPSSDWKAFSTSELTLRAMPFDEGLLLTTRRNTCETHAANHNELVDCVEKTSLPETDWYGASVVDRIDHTENIHGLDDNYTSHYTGYFLVDLCKVGTWSFKTLSDGGSEIEVDGTVVAGVYGGPGTHSGFIDLAEGWHRIVYRHQEIDGPQLAEAQLMSPDDTAWMAFPTTELNLKTYGADRDWDGLPDSVEEVLGTDPERWDTDQDEVGDLYEAAHGLDPLSPDSNDDGLIDYLEITHGGTLDASADLDGDGTPNVWDDDNDDDGVPDGLDPSPFSMTETSASIHLDIQMDGNPTYIDFQLRPQDLAHLTLPDDVWDWPADYDGQMQDIDDSLEDIRITPMLEISASQYPLQAQISDYGMSVVNSFEPSEWSDTIHVDGIGALTEGGGAALADIDGNGTPDLLLMGIDAPSGENEFRYKIGWNVGSDGQPASWTGTIEVAGVGALAEGGGAALADINGNGTPDLLLMGIDAPSGENEFRYKIGWDLDSTTGVATSWSSRIDISGLGNANAGGGVAVADINDDGTLDLLLMGIDDPAGDNEFRYKIGWDLSTTGVATSWSSRIDVPGIGNSTSGGGVSVADINGNGTLDLLLMGVDAPSGANAFRYKVGWDLDSSGQPSGWSTQVEEPGLDFRNDGGGAAIADIDGDGLLDMLLMGVDDVSGANDFFYKVGWGLENKLYVPLSPVKDDGTTVALGGRMYYPASDLGTLSLDAELVWMVRGETERFGQALFSPIIESPPMNTSGDYPHEFIPGYPTLVPTTITLDELAVSSGAAMSNLGGDPNRPDLLLAGISRRTVELSTSGINPTYRNFCYRVGWDLDSDGNASSWSDVNWSPQDLSLGSGEGVLGSLIGNGAAIADVDDNGLPDLILMAIDYEYNPGSRFWYIVGHDVQPDGSVDHWGDLQSGPRIGNPDAHLYNQGGGGVAVEDIDGDGSLDLLLMSRTADYDTVWIQYWVGWNLDANGTPAYSSPMVQSPSSDKTVRVGSGADLADLNGNGAPDLVITTLKNQFGDDELQYQIAWDLDQTGQPSHWTEIRPVRQDLGTRSEDRWGHRGGGVAIGDVDGNGRPDVLMATSHGISPADRIIKYTIGWDLGSTSTVTLARYKESFYLTSLKVEENHGSEVGLFYSESADETTDACAILRYEFLNSQLPLSDITAVLAGDPNADPAQDPVDVRVRMRTYAHQDEALAGAAELTAFANGSLADGQKLPIVFALEDSSASVWLDELVTDSYILGSSLSLDVSAEDVVTAKTLKMPWYDTSGTGRRLDLDEIVTVVQGWEDWDPLEKEQALKLLLLWDIGETKLTGIGGQAMTIELSEHAETMALIRRGFGGLKALCVAPGLILGAGVFLRAWAGTAGFTAAAKSAYSAYQIAKGLKVAPAGIARAQSVLGRTLSQGKWLTRFARAAKFAHIIGVLIGIGLAIWAFVEIAKQYDWSSYGMTVALIYSGLMLGYLLVLELIALIPVVGAVLVLLVILSDVLAWLITGTSWSDTLIGWIVDPLMAFENVTTLDLDVMETDFFVQDVHDNGLTASDEIRIEMRAREKVSVSSGHDYLYAATNSTAYGYVRPKVEILRLDDLDFVIWGRNWVDEDLHVSTSSEPYRTTDWYLTSHVKPNAGINVPIEIQFQTAYRSYYWTAENGTESDSGTKSYTLTKLYFDVVPDTLNSFVTWDELTSVVPVVAEAGGPYTVYEGGLVTLYGTGSADPGSSLTYAWDLDQNGTFEVNGQTVVFKAADFGLDGPGKVVVVLRVCEQEDPDRCDTDTVEITVENVPPTIALSHGGIGFEGSVDEGSEYTLTLGAVKDHGDDTVTAYIVHWGDGESDTYTTAGDVTHTYADGPAGPTITVDLVDEDGTHEEEARYMSLAVGNVVPSVDPGPAATINEGDTFESNGSFTDPGADTWTATVDYGDGNAVQTLTLNSDKTFVLSHAYESDNSPYQVTIWVTDDDGDTGFGIMNVTVLNVAPTVDAGSDGSINEGDTFVSSGSFTNPRDGTWTGTVDYGDGTDEQILALNSDKTFDLSHTYVDDDPSDTASDTYTVLVTVANDYGDVAEDTTVVTVLNVAPTVDAGPDATINEGETFVSSGSFTDPGDDTWMATVDYGDGTGPQTLLLNADKTFDLSHVYASDDGTYTVQVCVTDDDLGQGCDSAQVTIDNVVPVVDAGDDVAINEGETFVSSGSFTDAGNDTWTATVDYGDGTGVQTLTLNSDKTFDLSHVYASDDDTYQVSVTVTDDDLGAHTDTVQVTVDNVAPTIAELTVVPGQIDENESVVLDCTFTDPGVPDTHTVVIEWQDGSSDTIELTNGERSFAASHQYLDDDPSNTASDIYVIAVTITDDDLGAHSGTAQVTVANIPPTVYAGPDATINEGETFVSSGSFTDPGNDIWMATVDYGNGSGEQELALNADKTFDLSYAYAPDDGIYNVTATVMDDDGGVGEGTAAVTVLNVAPTITDLVVAPEQINENQSVELSCTFTDPGADTHTALINWGDGGSDTIEFAGGERTFIVGHQYLDDDPSNTASDIYVIAVTITDDDLGAHDGAVQVTVANIPPTVYAGPDGTINEGETFVSSGSFTDPGDDTWTATVDYGDGTSELTLALNADKAFDLIHAYAPDDGIYNVTAAVIDDDGGVGENTVVVTVLNVAPTVDAGLDGTINEGETFMSSGSFTDPGDDTWTATVDYGDGSGVQPLMLNPDKTFDLSHTYVDDDPTGTPSDTYVVQVTVTDDDDGMGSADTTVTVDNVSPSVTAQGNSIAENCVATVSGTITDPGTQDTFIVVIDWGEGAPQSYSYPAGSTSYQETRQYLDDNPTGTSSDIHGIDVTVTDDDGGVGSADTTVIVDNVSPSVTAQGDSIDENGVSTVSGTITDPGTQDTFIVVIDWGEGAPQSYSYPAGSTSYQETHQYLDDNPTGTSSDIYGIAVTVTDDDGGVGSADTTVTVDNLTPELGSIVTSFAPVPVNTAIEPSAVFSDQGTMDTHVATWYWDWGNWSQTGEPGPSNQGTVTEAGGSGSVAGGHSYELPGVYSLRLTVSDDDGGEDAEEFRYVVIYDPNDGFVTGGGWILSPVGAYAPDPSLTGEATFGFVSKYKKGANVPTGETEFQFETAGLDFHSDAYEWLVIAGSRAMYKGVGTINLSGNYGFMLTAFDADVNKDDSHTADRFRIKIWDRDNGDQIVYDNQLGDADDAEVTTEIGGGSIVIHSK